MNVGAPGRDSDGGVFSNCALSSLLESRKLNIPDPKNLPNSALSLPYVILADDAFPLKEYIMKPYSARNLDIAQRVFNYRLSRARRIIENVFGILSSRFRVLRKRIEVLPSTAKKIVCAVCALHNFLMYKAREMYAPVGSFDIEQEDGTYIGGTWRNENSRENRSATNLSRNATQNAKYIRDEFKNYFNSVGSVPWQYNAI